jgi:glutamyl-tRNA synthetase
MIAKGTAFRCYCTSEEVEALRAEAHVQGRSLRSPWRNPGTAAPDAPYVVRLRAPDSGEVVNEDLVQGRVAIKAQDIDDLVLLRADGTPTYMLSVVVDDHDMGITHVIRGDDHLTNAARQIPLFQAMGWTPPLYAHIPLIHGEDGKKLSKRHGAQAVHEWRDMGYLPEAMNSYLMRLGWSPGHDDILTKEEAVPLFALEQIGRAPSRLDFKKLDSVSAHFIAAADDARLADLVFGLIAAQKNWKISPEARVRVGDAMPVLKTRAKTLLELADQAYFLIRERPVTLDANGQKLMKEETKALLRRLRDRLAALPEWQGGALTDALKAFAAEEGVGMGQFGPALRAVLTGGTPAPDLGLALGYLGRAEALARMSDHI